MPPPQNIIRVNEFDWIYLYCRPVDRNKNSLHLSNQDFSSLPFIIQSEKRSLSSSQSETRSNSSMQSETRSSSSIQSETRISNSINQSEPLYASVHQSQDWTQQRNYTSLIIRNFGHGSSLDDSGSGYNKSMNDNSYKSLNVDEPRADDSSIKVNVCYKHSGEEGGMPCQIPPPINWKKEGEREKMSINLDPDQNKKNPL